MMRIRLTLDDHTVRSIDRLSARRGSTRSALIREAVRQMAERERFEDYLDQLEKQPAIQKSIKRSLADEREGRLISYEQVLKRLRKTRRR